MPVDDGVRNWARAMRRAARDAERHAETWRQSFVEGVTGVTGQPPPPSYHAPLSEEEMKHVAQEYAQKVACFCGTLPRITGDRKEDHVLACTDVWLEYLNGNIDLEKLKKRVEEIYGEGSFQKAKEASEQACSF